jgi:hypothetical protein
MQRVEEAENKRLREENKRNKFAERGWVRQKQKQKPNQRSLQREGE